MSFPVSTSSKSSKSSKKLKCKSKREAFSLDKHCGVYVIEEGRPCHNLLNCMKHSVQLRRQVPGRSKSFDLLFAEQHGPDEHIVSVSVAVSAG